MAPSLVPLETTRLLLRPWRDADLAPFAALNADPEVTRHLPGPLTRPESDALAARLCEHVATHGWGLWAVEHAGAFIGFIGLARPRFDAPFGPAVEVGWRLARPVWGRGLATEGARAARDFAREHLAALPLVSFTVPANTASRRVMEKIGLVHDPTADFDHPALPIGHPLRRHVLYRDPR